MAQQLIAGVVVAVVLAGCSTLPDYTTKMDNQYGKKAAAACQFLWLEKSGQTAATDDLGSFAAAVGLGAETQKAAVGPGFLILYYAVLKKKARKDERDKWLKYCLKAEKWKKAPPPRRNAGACEAKTPASPHCLGLQRNIQE